MFTSEVRSSTGSWNAVSMLEEHGLCEADYTRVTGYADAMADPGGNPIAILGMPMRGNRESLGRNHCDCCQAELPEHASTMELVPTKQAYRRGSRTHRDGALRRLRLCRQCLNWWRLTISDPSAMLGEGFREFEGASGGWINPGHGDAVCYALRTRDEAILATTMEIDGKRLRCVEYPGPLAPGEIAFVGTGKKDRAGTFVRSLDLAARSRVALVTQPDQLADAAAALQLGAREMLASPVSPQQLVGAFVRAGRPNANRRDADTGLVILGAPAPGLGLSCVAFSVRARNPMHVLELALSARRFLRGYDEVGSDGRGGLAIHVYCDLEFKPQITARLRLLMGKGTDVVPGADAA
jgi:hypothetical protein